MSEKIVYLSGAMMDCTDAECKDWREEAKQLLNCATRDPAALRDYRGREDEAIAEVVEDDKADIDTCTFVLVNYIKPSVAPAWRSCMHGNAARRFWSSRPAVLY